MQPLESGRPATVQNSRPPLSKQQRIVRAVILIVGSITLLSFLFADPLLRTFTHKNLQGVRPQIGTAIVVTLVPAGSSLLGTPQPPLVVVRFRGHLYQAGKVIGFDRLQLNRPARIVYRVGHNATIYVDEVAPLNSSQNVPPGAKP
ncbi:hypothetical protein [Chthonomonas calidirosea]|uniref:hypothetical protein n=1 Tax=Chthonomonas calidirosea TaxID=454171 RepID=UPI0006EC5FA1|nr:hypothetical protein [Chthonomonas calidirosea]CEK17127.1 hypothetical protein CP488_01745 [Chthonomonas calidirosea]